jgi:hypothetical protein
MAAFQCFFCKKFAKCEDHNEKCTEFEGKSSKTEKKGNKLTVTFK